MQMMTPRERIEGPPLDDAVARLARSAVGRMGIRELEEMLRRTMIDEALRRASGNIQRAADLLGVSRQHLQHMLRSRRA